MCERIALPPEVRTLLQRLNAAGFSAFAVGGCVRDSLLGRTAQDWDICTSALPQQTEACFSDCRTILTGVRYGTVTVIFGGQTYEITTFRAENDYADHRHPDAVQFLDDIVADLARRDFTVNAMAADVSGCVTDPFGGAVDLQRRILRCVGRAEERFSEDALRILRALRFASALDFTLEEETANAMHALRGELSAVAPERLGKELRGLLCGRGAARIMAEFADVLCVPLPELTRCIGFRQYNPHHALDVWGHTLAALDAAEQDFVLRMALLLHDVGKPACFLMDKNLVGHFYGHAVVSAAMCERILRRLRFDGQTISRVTELVAAHGCTFLPLTPRRMRRILAQYGEETSRSLLRLKRADRLGKQTEPPTQIETFTAQAQALIEALCADCFTIARLRISGRELLALGVPEGREIGVLLRALLQAVMEERVPNEPTALVQYAQRMMKKTEGD